MDVAQRVEKTRKRFPSITAAQRWLAIPVDCVSAPSNSGVDGGAVGNQGSALDHNPPSSPVSDPIGDDDDFASHSIRSPALLQAVRSFVRAQKRHQVSLTDNNEQELLLSSLVRVYSGEAENSNDDDDTSDDDAGELGSDQGDHSSHSSNSSHQGTCRPPSTRRRFAACTASLQRRAVPKVANKLSSLLKEVLAENNAGDIGDEITIDIHPDDLLRLEGRCTTQQYGSSGPPSRSTSNSNLAALRRNMENHAAGTGGGGGGVVANSGGDRNRTLHYLRRGGNEDTLREHFQSASLTADSETTRREQQQQKLATAKKLVEQHKKILKQRYEVFQTRRGGQYHAHHQHTSSTGQQFNDPFSGKASLATNTKGVMEAHKRMYFSDVPPTTVGVSTAPSTVARGHRYHRGRHCGPAAVRLSAIEETQESGGASGGSRRGSGDDSGSLTDRYILGYNSAGGEASMAIRPGELPIEDGWAAPF
jgi:hypothetical protein